jgi:hypothetical protein
LIISFANRNLALSETLNGKKQPNKNKKSQQNPRDSPHLQPLDRVNGTPPLRLLPESG